MDYKYIIYLKLKELIENAEDLTFGELLYSILREKMIGKKISKVSDLLDVKDEAILTSIDKCIDEVKDGEGS